MAIEPVAKLVVGHPIISIEITLPHDCWISIHHSLTVCESYIRNDRPEATQPFLRPHCDPGSCHSPLAQTLFEALKQCGENKGARGKTMVKIVLKKCFFKIFNRGKEMNGKGMKTTLMVPSLQRRGILHRRFHGLCTLRKQAAS